MRRSAAALGAATLAVVAAGPADAARFAVGVRDGAALDRVARLVGDVDVAASRDLAPLRVLVVRSPDAARLASVPGVEYVEPLGPLRRMAFVPTDPLSSRQWYLGQIRAFNFWPQPPMLAAVKVAVIDSGVDGGHPELAGRIAASRSFVGGSALTDEHGHGTFLAGQIAAATNNGLGIAGIGLSAELVVAKVVGPDRTISLDDEAAAIRWAVDSGARVINLSLGGLRDPVNRRRDTFSRLEAAAIEYAADRGAVLVAAVGNGDQAPVQPWPFASYPAALPHVLGVSAVTREGSVPRFSNRDPVFNDLAAPGLDIFSTLPRALTAARAGCPEQGYSSCGPEEYRKGDGTSFAAPLVAAAAALLLAANPRLSGDQVTAILERSALDASVATGCRFCPPRRDSLSGWGRLDVFRALGKLSGPLPARDRFETNDDAGARAQRLWGSRPRRIRATLDFWDDPVDVYAVRLAAGHRLTAAVRGPSRRGARLVLWKPGTPSVEAGAAAARFRAAQSALSPATRQLVYRAARGGWYFLEVRAGAGGFGPYTLSFRKR